MFNISPPKSPNRSQRQKQARADRKLITGTDEQIEQFCDLSPERQSNAFALTDKALSRSLCKQVRAMDVPKAPLKIRLPEVDERQSKQMKFDLARKAFRKMQKIGRVFDGIKKESKE